MQRCQLCGKEIKNKPGRVHHPSCIKKMFGVNYFPSIGFSASALPKHFQKMKGKLSISSLQPKVPVKFNRKEKRLELAASPEEKEFVLKPQVKELKNLPQNEHTAMTIASHMGITVYPHCLLPLDDNQTAYIFRQSDRLDKKKVRQENFLQILGEENRYSGDLLEIGTKLLHISDIPGLDVQLFFERVMLFFLIGHSDIHFEDFSVFYNEEGEIRLSPAYNIISSRLAVPQADNFSIPMLGKTRNIKGVDFMAFSRQLQIPEKAYTKIFLRFFKGKRIIGKIIKDSSLDMETQLKFSDLINDGYKQLLG